MQFYGFNLYLMIKDRLVLKITLCKWRSGKDFVKIISTDYHIDVNVLTYDVMDIFTTVYICMMIWQESTSNDQKVSRIEMVLYKAGVGTNFVIGVQSIAYEINPLKACVGCLVRGTLILSIDWDGGNDTHLLHVGNCPTKWGNNDWKLVVSKSTLLNHSGVTFIPFVIYYRHDNNRQRQQKGLQFWNNAFGYILVQLWYNSHRDDIRPRTTKKMIPRYFFGSLRLN